MRGTLRSRDLFTSPPSPKPPPAVCPLRSLTNVAVIATGPAGFRPSVFKITTDRDFKHRSRRRVVAHAKIIEVHKTSATANCRTWTARLTSRTGSASAPRQYSRRLGKWPSMPTHSRPVVPMRPDFEGRWLACRLTASRSRKPGLTAGSRIWAHSGPDSSDGRTL